MVTFYNRIKQIREDKDKKQSEIAELLGVHQTYYSKQERGIKPFQVEQIIKICEYFNVSADYILGLERGLEWPREEKRKYTDNCTKCTFLHRNFLETKNRPYGLFFIVTATSYGGLPKNVIETRDSYQRQRIA